MDRLRGVVVAIAVLLGAGTALGDGSGPGAAGPDGGRSDGGRPDGGRSGGSDRGGGILALLPGDSVSRHTAAAGGARLAYTATAGTLALRDGDGARVAALYYTAYVLDRPADGAGDGSGGSDRPVTIAFNGGPGAASAYLHLGLAGPRLAEFGDPPDGTAARLADNPDTWLRFTDLVFMDPVGTGWSRAEDDAAAKGFWSVGGDARWMAKATALWLARNGRMQAPLYLLGESYGGFRAAKVAAALQEDQGIVPDGLVMVSPYLDGALHAGTSWNALSAALLLPSMAAATMDRQGRFSAAALAAAERFALTDYLVALAGPSPVADAVTARVAEISGLPVDVVRRTAGFIARAYRREAGDGARISGYDGAFVRPEPFPASPGRGGDPVLDGFTRALAGLFVAHARERLGFATEITYRLLSGEVGGAWDWEGGRAGASAVGDLREGLALNPGQRLLVAHGRTDLVTPYMASRYILDHLPPAPGGAERARLAVYPGGHMFYFDAAARAAFTADAAAFYAAGGR